MKVLGHLGTFSMVLGFGDILVDFLYFLVFLDKSSQKEPKGAKM